MFYQDYEASPQGIKKMIDDIEKIYSYEFSEKEGKSIEEREKFRNFIESLEEKLKWYNENHRNVDESKGNSERIRNLLKYCENEFRKKWEK